MRKLLYVPVIHDEADLGTLGPLLEKVSSSYVGPRRWQRHRETVAAFWEAVEAFMASLDPKALKVYQDGLAADGEIGRRVIEEAARRGSHNHRILLELTIAAGPDGVVLADNLIGGIGQESLTFQQCLEAIRLASPNTIMIQYRAMAIGGEGFTASALAADLGLERRPAEDSLVLAVYSLRGGVGKSTTAANLAWELAQDAPTILVDLDVRGGTIRHLLGAQDAGGGLHRLAQSRAALNGDLESYLARRGPLALLLPPEGMEACLDDSVSAEFLSDLVRQLALYYINVIIDLAPDPVNSPAVTVALSEASQILLLAQSTRVGLASLPSFLPVLADLGFEAKTRLVLSRVRGEIDQGQLARDLGIPVLARIPEDKAIAEAEDARQPVVGNSRSPAGQALRQLAGTIRATPKLAERQGG